MYTKFQVKGLPSYAISKKEKRTVHIDVYLNERNLIRMIMMMMIKDKCTSHIALEIELTLLFFFFSSSLALRFKCSATNINVRISKSYQTNDFVPTRSYLID